MPPRHPPKYLRSAEARQLIRDIEYFQDRALSNFTWEDNILLRVASRRKDRQRVALEALQDYKYVEERRLANGSKGYKLTPAGHGLKERLLEAPTSGMGAFLGSALTTDESRQRRIVKIIATGMAVALGFHAAGIAFIPGFVIPATAAILCGPPLIRYAPRYFRRAINFDQLQLRRYDTLVEDGLVVERGISAERNIDRSLGLRHEQPEGPTPIPPRPDDFRKPRGHEPPESPGRSGPTLGGL